MEERKKLKDVNGNDIPVAVLFQSHHPPEVDNIRKPMKPTGYRDSSADIAVAMKSLGLQIVTPVDDPDVSNDEDWCFADSSHGMKEAFDKGARVFWLNTVLYKEHPITQYFDQDILLIGQSPDCVNMFDDKYLTNQLLHENGIPIPNEMLIGVSGDAQALLISEITAETLTEKGFDFPLVVKPLRGRGSQGVKKVETLESLFKISQQLLAEHIEIDEDQYLKFGNRLILEEFLEGEEVTVTVMPPGEYVLDNKLTKKENYWALPLVTRFGHHDGVAPYNGVVAVAENSQLLNEVEANDKKYIDVTRACEKSAGLIGAKAPIRVDCRFKKDKGFIFDLNLKPNMTGAIRPHRSNQNSLTAMAAQGINWDYKQLVFNMYNQAWSPKVK